MKSEDIYNSIEKPLKKLSASQKLNLTEEESMKKYSLSFRLQRLTMLSEYFRKELAEDNMKLVTLQKRTADIIQKYLHYDHRLAALETIRNSERMCENSIGIFSRIAKIVWIVYTVLSLYIFTAYFFHNCHFTN